MALKPALVAGLRVVLAMIGHGAVHRNQLYHLLVKAIVAGLLEVLQQARIPIRKHRGYKVLALISLLYSVPI